MRFNPEHRLINDVNEFRKKKERRKQNMFPSFFDNLPDEIGEEEGNNLPDEIGNNVFPSFFDNLPDEIGEEEGNNLPDEIGNNVFPSFFDNLPDEIGNEKNGMMIFQTRYNSCLEDRLKS